MKMKNMKKIVGSAPRAQKTLTFGFLDTHVSLAPTHVCLSVSPLVRDTFGFPANQRLWSPYVKS